MGRFVVKNAHSFLLLSLCSLIGAVLYWSCITGRQFLVFHGDIGTDTYLSYWAYDRYFYNLFKSRSFSFWSFCVGLGSQVNWLPKFLNPLHQLLYLGGEDRILYMYSIKALLASIFAAFFWFRYLKYFKVRDSIAVVFSIYYGFSGFVTLWGQHQFNHIAYVLFPIILYALELLFKENKPLLYSLALSYLYIVSWHNGVCLSVFLLIYAVYRLYEEFGFSKKALIAFFKFAGFSVVSVGIGVVNLLVEYDVLSSTIRLTSRAYKHRWLFESAYYKTFLARLFSNNLTGNPLHGYFGTWNYYEDPQVYCGLLTLVFLLPILLKGSKKYATTLFLLTCVAFIVLPDLTASFMLFTKVSSRQSFILILALLTIVPRRLNTLEEELNDSGSR
ncbi:MAG: YfhO family protein, partial [Deltaproteobacteria bacterium]|nr:YfhO family protein [Deltaproteobacteria bacterium]